MRKNLNTNYKIITYGCSFTSYITGTYADILGCDYITTNRGRSGAGNSYIKFCLMQDFKSGVLHDIDLIVIQWSAFNRWNYKHKDNWIGMGGNIFNKHNKESRTAYRHVRSFYDVDYEEENFENDMLLVKGFLESKNINHIILSYGKTKFDFVDIDNLYDRYKGNYTFLTGEDWIQKPFEDNHPTLMSHLKIAEKIAPISKKTKKFVETKHLEILDRKEFRDHFLDFPNRNITTGS